MLQWLRRHRKEDRVGLGGQRGQRIEDARRVVHGRRRRRRRGARRRPERGEVRRPAGDGARDALDEAGARRPVGAVGVGRQVPAVERAHAVVAPRGRGRVPEVAARLEVDLLPLAAAKESRIQRR